MGEYVSMGIRGMNEIADSLRSELLGMGFEKASMLDRLRGYQLKSQRAKVGVAVEKLSNIRYADGEPRFVYRMAVKAKQKNGESFKSEYFRPNESEILSCLERFISPGVELGIPNMHFAKSVERE